MRIIPTLALAVFLLPLSADTSSAADAITSGNGGTVLLGSHWGPYETYRGEAFRWVANDAEIIVRGGGGREARVAIACEGGPSLGQRSFPLRVFDTSRRQVDHVFCDGAARRVEMLLPLSGAETRYVLHADGGGRPVAGEKRVLNFRVFSLDDGRGTAGARDVVDQRSGVRLGAGWYPLESYRGQTFRWMAHEGRIWVASDRATRGNLRLLAEVGPSVGSPAATVTVRDGRNHVVLRTTLKGRGVMIVPLQLEPGQNEFTIAVSSKNKRVPHDARILDLRVISASAQR
jgi:hypothetical protein